MTKLPATTDKNVEKVARKLGFVFKRHGAGSHEIWLNPESGRRLVIAKHSGKNLKPGTMRQTLKDLNINSEEFIKLLK